MSTASIATVITDVGFDLLRAAPGHKLVYTRAVCGSGHVEKTQLTTLTEITDYVMDLSIVEFGPSESAATLRLQLDNSKAPKEFQLYQIGVLAKLLDGEDEVIGETLVQVMQYEKPDIVRAVPHVSEFVVNVLMGQAETVEGTIDMAAYVSIRQFSSRTVNGKPLSEDITLTGEDIKVSDSDPTTVEASLSNKADKHTQMIAPVGSIEALRELTPGKYSWVQPSPMDWQPEDTPFGLLRVELDIRKAETRQSFNFYLAYIDGATNLRRYYCELNSESEIRWRKFAVATKPNMFNFLLADIWSTDTVCQYCKDQFGVVMVDLDINSASYVGGTKTHVATLPEGYRPKWTKVLTGSIRKLDQYDTIKAAQFIVDTQGNIFVCSAAFDGHVYARVIGEFQAT